MAIEFHCVHCNHLVKTTDENAGKRGKCPHCHQSVYIPTPSDQIEPLDLVPLSAEEEAEKQQVAEEARRLAEALRQERGTPPAESGAGHPARPAAGAPAASMETLVIEYVLAMAEGNLNEAEKLRTQIHTDMNRANEIIDRLTIDEMPPRRLARVPRPVLQGFLRQLRSD